MSYILFSQIYEININKYQEIYFFVKKFSCNIATSKQLKPNKMNHYENKIDEIGESMEKENLKIDQLGKLHEDIINKNTYIASLKREIRNLDELIHGNKTYSHDVNFQEKLKYLSQRMKNDLKALEKSCEGMGDFIEQQLK